MPSNIIKIIPGSYIISVIIFFNFIIPQVIVPRSIFILIFTIIPAIYLFLKNKFEIISTLLILSLTLITFISPDISKLLNAYYLILFLVLARAHKGAIRIQSFENILIVIGTISIIIQIFYFAITNNDPLERTGLGTDPNFSGLTVLILFFFLKKTNKAYAFIPLVLGILVFQSRALIVSTLVFFIIEKMRHLSIFNKIFKKTSHAFSLIILTNGIFVIFGTIYLQQTFFTNDDANIKDVSRLVRINDSSTQSRIIANNIWSLEILTGKYNFQSENVENVAFGDELIPHNSFIYMLVTSSIMFSFIYLVFLSYLLNPLLKGRNYEYFFSYLCFSLILHGLYGSIFLFPFLLVLLINNNYK